MLETIVLTGSLPSPRPLPRLSGVSGGAGRGGGAVTLD